MASRTLQASVSLLLLLLVWLSFITDNRTAATTLREKCQCVTETDNVRWKKITDYKVIQNDPLCNKVQIILETSSNQKICLNPHSMQGKKLLRCWKGMNFNTEMKKVCLELQKKKKKKKGPKKSKKN